MAPEAANDARGGPGAPLGTRRERGLAALVVLAFGLVLLANLAGHDDSPRGGWDETMHLQLPAARILVALQAGEAGLAFEALHDCHQYPFVAPLYLACAQGLLGLSEAVARWAVLALWVASLSGLVALGSELRHALGPRRAGPRPSSGPSAGPGAGPSDRPEARGARWVVLLLPAGLAFASPLATRYAGTLFLEVPVACALTWTLVAWLRRRRLPGAARDLFAGAWIALTVFTKFNYGVLLAAGLGLDWLLGELRRAPGGRGSRLAEAARLAAVPLLASLWWFVLPLPAGLARAAQHRASFVAYLFAERGTAAVPWTRRLVDWAGGVAANPTVLVLTVALALVGLTRVRRPALRSVLCVLLATGLPVWFHPFHLDRFLLPGAIPLWVAAGAGAYLVVQRLDPWRDNASATASSLLVFVLAALMALFPLRRLADAVGLFSEDPELRAYQESVLDDLRWGARVASAGLAPEEHARLVDWVADELAEGERFAWIGLTSELSPASIHLELLARGGDRERFLRDAHRQVDVTPVPGMPDPGWSVDELARFLADFDVVFMTHPPDLKDRAGARGIEDRYQRPLIDELDYGVEQLGTLEISNPPGDPLSATLYALRRP